MVALRVALTGPQQQTVRVVGVVVLPTLGDQLTLGTGAALTVDELKHLAPPTMGVPAYDTLVVRLRPGADQQAAVARLSAELVPRGAFAVSRFQTPDDLLNFGGVRAMPTLLGILLALVLALAVSAPPGEAAARITTARILRSE